MHLLPASPGSLAGPRAYPRRTRGAPWFLRPLHPSLRARLALPLLVVLLVGCGPDDAPTKGTAPVPQRWRVTYPTAAEQARFALDRLLKGPLPQEVLRIPDQHSETLRSARADLIVLGEESLRLLSEPDLLEQVAGPQVRNLDGWHNVLEVLTAIRHRDTELCLRWTRSVLARKVPGLSLRAVDLLGTTADPAVGPLLFEFLEEARNDRSLQREVWRALARLPEPWPSRALALVRSEGSPEIWLEVAGLLADRTGGHRTRARGIDLLAWWTLLAEPGGPRGPVGTPRVKTLPWSGLAARLGPGAPRPVPVGAAGDMCPGPWPQHLAEAAGWLSVAPVESPVLSAFHLAFTGLEPAADARCRLALEEVPAFVASVARDLNASEELLRAKARHCMVGGAGALPSQVRLVGVETLLARARSLSALGEHPTVSEVSGATRALPGTGDPGGPEALERVLSGLRPVADWLGVLEAAYGSLLSLQDGRAQRLLRDWLGGTAAPERGLALHLAHKTRDVSLLPDLERLLDRASDEARVGLMRVIWWIHAAGGAEPGLTVALAERYAGWIQAAGDAQALSLASGLLDLGDRGHELFVDGLRGPRRRLYLEALSRLTRILPVVIAEALADLVEPTMEPDLRRAALLALWRSAPAPAAPAIAAIQGRLLPADRPAVALVLQTVLHRAARP